MIERAPKIEKKVLNDALMGISSPEIEALVDKINDTYEYWDKVKYKDTTSLGISAETLWSHVKISRMKSWIVVWKRYGIRLGVTNQMQRLCHEFDMLFGSFWETDDSSAKEKTYYLASSLMEEAIFSSKMEGASTTRLKAKEMLKKDISPKNKSQQMIVNNYRTIQYISERKNEPLTEEGLRYIHQLMTENTLENAHDAGRFRTQEDNVVVEEGISHEVVHTPPPAEDLPDFVKDLCVFFNTNDETKFIHPIIKGIVIHFMIAYMHPFVDGNGRTARALFYWYMLKEKYWLTEYMSISRVIAESKRAYEKSFLYTEYDDKDMGYFVTYNLRTLKISFDQLKQYIERKHNEKQAASAFIMIGGINERQAQIIRYFQTNPDAVVTVKEMQDKFIITQMTARRDLTELVAKGYLREVPINKVKRGYLRSESFDEKINS